MRQISADDIAGDDKKLEQMVAKEIGTQVRIDINEAETSDPDSVHRSIRAILVKVNGGEGAIRGSEGFFLRTGPGQREGYDIVIIDSGQICVLFGKPSIRYFRGSG